MRRACSNVVCPAAKPKSPCSPNQPQGDRRITGRMPKSISRHHHAIDRSVSRCCAFWGTLARSLSGICPYRPSLVGMGFCPLCFWKRKEKQETAKNFLLGGAAGGRRVFLFRRLIRQTMRRFSGRPSRTSSIPFSYSCRILNRFRKPIRIRMIQGDHQLLDLTARCAPSA